MARISFALDMLRAHWSPQRSLCPYCGSRLHRRLQRKKLLIEARKCEFCSLVFRWPCDDPERARRFYEGAYDGQQATTMPDTPELDELARRRFHGTAFDRSHRVARMKTVLASGRLLDFGCSWGYSLVQWTAAGYDAIGFESARTRARFGRERLGLDIRDDFAMLEREPAASLDAVYADHVIEHLPLLRPPLEQFARLLKPGGVLLMFTPNGGGSLARRLGTGWSALIGESHTIALTAEWCNRNLPDHGFQPLCFSGASPARSFELVDDEELVCQATRL